MEPLSSRRLAALLLAATSVVACDAGTGPGPSDGEPLYVVQTVRVLPSGRTSLFAPVASLDAPAIDPARSLEVAGSARLYTAPGIGTFLIGAGESPTITRYAIGNDGSFVPETTLSFANYGVTALAGRAVTFVSPTKAYYRDGTQLQLIAFDPTEMRITGAVPVPDVAREGFVPAFGQAVVREDGVYFPVFHYSLDVDDRVPLGAILVHVDPATDAVTVTTDPRCAGLDVQLTTDEGDTYWFSSNINTAAWRGYGTTNAVHDCALRLRAGESTFDQDWFLDLTTRTGGYAALPKIPAGDGRIWIRVLDETAVEVPSPADYYTFFDLPGCQWYLLDVESDADAVRNDDRPLSTCGGNGFLVDGRAFTFESQDAYATSTLIELTPDGFQARATVDGFIAEIARVR